MIFLLPEASESVLDFSPPFPLRAVGLSPLMVLVLHPVIHCTNCSASTPFRQLSLYISVSHRRGPPGPYSKCTTRVSGSQSVDVNVVLLTLESVVSNIWWMLLCSVVRERVRVSQFPLLSQDLVFPMLHRHQSRIIGPIGLKSLSYLLSKKVLVINFHKPVAE